MAKPKPILIDGEYREVKPTARIIDVVPAEVTSVVTHDGALIPRSEFSRVAVPEGFQTNLSAINKGAGGIRLRPRNSVACAPLLQKGGAHLRSRKTGRQQARMEIARDLRDLAVHGSSSSDRDLLRIGRRYASGGMG